MSLSFLEVLSDDPVMADLIARVGPLDFQPRRLSPFQSLTRAVIYQQLSGKAAGTILGRFEALFGGFPAPEAVLQRSAEELRAAGLSRPKTGYILDIARHAAEGSLPTLEQCDTMEDQALIERLTEIKGIGRWTVEMLLIFNLGRPDVMPVHDLGVRHGYQIAFHKRQPPTPKHLERQSKRWKPFRTTAALYLWRAVDMETVA